MLGQQNPDPVGQLFERIAAFSPHREVYSFDQFHIQSISQLDYTRLTPISMRMRSRLFGDSQIIRDNGENIYYYALNNTLSNYYQLVICVKGHYSPMLVLCNFSTAGNLVGEHLLVGNFADGAEAYEWTSKINSRGELLFTYKSFYQNEAEGFLCDSVERIFSIRNDGRLKKLQEIKYKVAISGLRGPVKKVLAVEEQKSKVMAPSGLKLRQELRKRSKTIAIVPYGAEVDILSVSSDAFAIDWVKGNWAYVQFDTLKGYIFDGYLSTLPIPLQKDSMSCYHQLPDMLANYLDTHFELDGSIDSIQAKSTSAGDDYVEYEKNYANNFELNTYEYGNGKSIKLQMPNTTIDEAYIFIMSLLQDCKEFDKLKEDLLFVKNRAREIYKIYDRTGYVNIRRRPQNIVELHFQNECCLEETDLSRSE